MPVLVATLQQGELPAGCLALQHLPQHRPPPARGFLLQRKQLPWGRKRSLFFFPALPSKGAALAASRDTAIQLFLGLTSP